MMPSKFLQRFEFLLDIVSKYHAVMSSNRTNTIIRAEFDTLYCLALPFITSFSNRLEIVVKY
jgi:hypothetical protein